MTASIMQPKSMIMQIVQKFKGNNINAQIGKIYRLNRQCLSQAVSNKTIAINELHIMEFQVHPLNAHPSSSQAGKIQQSNTLI